MKTEQTVLNYRIRAEQLIKRVGREINSNQPTSYETAQWLVKNQHVLSKATWRQYRAALICYIDGFQGENEALLAESKDAINFLLATDTSQCKPRGSKTSAKKQKKISELDLEKLADYFLANPKIKQGLATFYWLVSGLWTGLRPSEWPSAQIYKDAENNWALTVRNAKNTNGRSHGDERIIHLSDISELEARVIHLHLTNITAAENNGISFLTFYHHCRDCLYQVNQKLWPNRSTFIGLYSARHQFAADAKKSGLDKASIAALMGHASIETAGIHYGRRVSGQSGFRVSANLADIARVEALNTHRLDKELDLLNSDGIRVD